MACHTHSAEIQCAQVPVPNSGLVASAAHSAPLSSASDLFQNRSALPAQPRQLSAPPVTSQSPLSPHLTSPATHALHRLQDTGRRAEHSTYAEWFCSILRPSFSLSLSRVTPVINERDAAYGVGPRLCASFELEGSHSVYAVVPQIEYLLAGLSD